MGFASRKALIDAELQGKVVRSHWQKTSGLTAYVAGRWYDMSMMPGAAIPRANVYPGGLRSATALTNLSSGSIYHGASVSPATKHIVKAGIYSTVSTIASTTFMLCDYLMFYALIDFDDDGVQEFDNPIALPRYPDGLGVRAFIVTTSDLGPSAFDMDISYTNTDDVQNRVMPVRVSGLVSSIPGHLLHSGVLANNYGPFLPLAPGDKGIKSVQSITLSVAGGQGWGALVLAKPLMNIQTMPVSNAIYYVTEKDLVLDCPSMPRVKDGAYLNFLIHAGGAYGASSMARGYLKFVWN